MIAKYLLEVFSIVQIKYFLGLLYSIHTDLLYNIVKALFEVFLYIIDKSLFDAISVVQIISSLYNTDKDLSGATCYSIKNSLHSFHSMDEDLSEVISIIYIPDHFFQYYTKRILKGTLCRIEQYLPVSLRGGNLSLGEIYILQYRSRD